VIIQFKNLERFIKEVQDRTYSFSYKTVLEYQAAVRLTLKLLAEASPQWTGQFAASWQVDLGFTQGAGGRFVTRTRTDTAGGSYKGGAGGYDDTGKRKDFRPLQMGDPAAVNHAMLNNWDRIESIKSLKTRVSLYNAVPYASNVETNTDESGKSPYLRPYNYVHYGDLIPIDYVKEQLRGRLL